MEQQYASQDIECDLQPARQSVKEPMEDATSRKTRLKKPSRGWVVLMTRLVI